MAPRPTKGKAFMLSQLYEAEGVPEENRGTSEYVSLTVNNILKRIEASRCVPKPSIVEASSDDERGYCAWRGF